MNPLENFMYKEQNSADEAEYEDATQTLFTSDDSMSWIDAQVYEIPFSHTLAQPENATQFSFFDMPKLSSLQYGKHQNSMEGVPPYLGQIETDVLRVRTKEELENFHAHTSVIGISNFLFIRQSHSWSRLYVCRDLFESVLAEYSIFPSFKTFVLSYGFKSEETDIGAPQLHFAPYKKNHAISKYEMAYTMRYVELSRRNNPARPWAERQTTVYNTVDSDSGASTWLFVSAAVSMQTRMNQYMQSINKERFHDPFGIHLLLLDCALSNWRPYLAYLTKDTNDRVNRVLVASVDGKGLVQLDKVEDRQRIQELGNLVADLMVMIDSTIDTVTSLIEKYQILQPEEALDGVNSVLFTLREKQRHAVLIRKKAKALSGRVHGAAQLLSSLLDLENGTALKNLAEEARAEGVIMRNLTERAIRDSTSVKILTIIALIYLPATAVSNFFSTDFVKQVQVGDSFKVTVGQNTWVLAAITVPLTAFTLSVWWLWLHSHLIVFSRRRQSGLLSKVQGRFQRRAQGKGDEEGRPV